MVSPLLPSSVCLMLSDWREDLGDGSVLLPVGLDDARKKSNENKSRWLKVHISRGVSWSHLIKVLYSLIFLLMRSWLVKAAF